MVVGVRDNRSLLPVQIVVKKIQFLSSQEATGQYFVETALELKEKAAHQSNEYHG